MSSLTVGLTGGLASGKSTVAGWLRQAGHKVIDADRLVSDLYRPGQPGVGVVRELFGDGALTAGGGVDHQRVAGIIFGDGNARRRLEEAIHPLVRERFRRIARQTDGVVVLEATLLVEADFAPEFDLLITVEADVDARVARAVTRGLTEDAARRRIAAQGAERERRETADVVIDNNGDLDALRRQTERLLAEIESIAGSGTEPRGEQ